MASGLTRGILEAHLVAGSPRPRSSARAAELGLRLDHALMDAPAATLVFQSFEATGRVRASGELVLVCAESPDGTPPFEVLDELRYVQSAARHYGAHFSRPGNGRAHHVYAARFAAPGRLLFACAGGAAAAGALGTLVLAVSELELAAALAGLPHAVAAPPVWAVRLEGRLPPWVGGFDLVLALARRIPAFAGPAPMLEYGGPGIGSLPQEARFTAAREGVALGLPGSLFPSDEVTREWLRGQGREPDWKPLVSDPEAETARVIEIHLDALEPMVARPESGSDPVEVREVTGLPIARVVLGPDAGLADLLLAAEMLRGRTVATGVELVVIPGSRHIRHVAAASGALAALRAAGARIVDAEVRLSPGSRHGTVLMCGASPSVTGRAHSAFRVGPAVGVASALVGRIADPRELPVSLAAPAPAERMAPSDALLVKPVGDPSAVPVVRGAAIRPLPTVPPLVATLRGVVLLKLPDRVGTEMVLPPGPKAWRHRADLAAMSAHLFAGLDPSFARRARVQGGGFVVAGTDYGIGPHRPHAVLALVQLGVRSVIAASFAVGHRAEMVRYGLLPLRTAADADPAGLLVGDELEIPGLPDGLERNKPLVIRNLTRGTQISLHHDLSDREIEMVRAGGLLAAGVAEGIAG